MTTLTNEKHEIVKLQLQRLEWAGSEGRFCPECGGARPKDGARHDTKDDDGRVILSTVDPAILTAPNPHEGHNANCSLAASIQIMSGAGRVVIFCQTGDPHGFEAGK